MREVLRNNGEILLRRYLLGQVSEEEQRTIDKRLLTDQDYFNLLLREEEELIDEYVRGEIHGGELKEFESRFLRDPERHESVKFAKAFHRYLHSQSGQKPMSVPRGIAAPRWLAMEIGLMCLLIALAAVSISLFRKMTALREQLAKDQIHNSEVDRRTAELSQEILRNQALVTELRREMAELEATYSGAASAAFLVLMPGETRSADQAASVNLSSKTRTLRLALQFNDEEHHSYRADLQTVEGTLVWSQGGLVPSRGTKMTREINLAVPARLLVRSDYLAMLSSTDRNVDNIATYYFKVVRKGTTSRR